jgi:hypothetical protein
VSVGSLGEQVLLELSQPDQMHFHRRTIDPLGGEAVRDGSHFDVLVQQHSEYGQVVFSLLRTHDLLHCAEADVVLVVDAVALQPSVEVFQRGGEMVVCDDAQDEFVVHAYFQDVLEEDAEQVGKHVSTLFLDGLARRLLIATYSRKWLYNCPP